MTDSMTPSAEERCEECGAPYGEGPSWCKYCDGFNHGRETGRRGEAQFQFCLHGRIYPCPTCAEDPVPGSYVNLPYAILMTDHAKAIEAARREQMEAACAVAEAVTWPGWGADYTQQREIAAETIVDAIRAAFASTQEPK